jgi:hypothetical protein
MAITPKGTRCFTILRPFGRTVSETGTRGSGSAATSLTAFAISSSLSGVSLSRSIITSEIPLSLASGISTELAASISSLFATRASAMAESIFSLVSGAIRQGSARRAAAHTLINSSRVISALPVIFFGFAP